MQDLEEFEQIQFEDTLSDLTIRRCHYLQFVDDIYKILDIDDSKTRSIEFVVEKDEVISKIRVSKSELCNLSLDDNLKFFKRIM